VNDAFVTKLDPSGSALIYSTYLGGSGDDGSRSIAVDASGNAYVSGFTSSADFDTVNAVQDTLGGDQDAFVAKLNPPGSALIYSTYLGGSATDFGTGIAVNRSGTGSACVVGFTYSTDFDTVNALPDSLGGEPDAFVAAFNTAGSKLVFSTYLGGSSDDLGVGIAINATGSAYVIGQTSSIDFPLGPNPRQSGNNGGVETFVAKIDPTLKTSARLNQDRLPLSFKLEQNYPNPFNPSTTIAFQVPVASHVTLKIYEMLGKEIATLVNERKSPGAYRVNFDASGLVGGIYFYRLQAGQLTQTRKLMLLR
ncbi:MAG: SBBP repeat-containing protein, partial [bacterium]